MRIPDRGGRRPVGSWNLPWRESWEVSPDGLAYTFKLRDAKFSDGSPVTVDDVVFSWERLNDPSAAYQFLLKPVKAIEKVDDHHMRVTLNEPYAPFLSVASIFASAIVKKAVFEKSADEFASKPVCSGPFMVESYERGTKVVLVKNPHYWKQGSDGQPLPYLDRVELLYVPDTNARVLGLQNGDYDVIAIVPFNQAKAVQETANLKLEVAEIYRLDYVYLNHSQKPLDDKRIRLAMNYAANLEAIKKAVFFEYGELPNSINPKMNFWSSEVKRIPFDIDKAKALVQEAGYDGTPIRLLIETGNAPAKQTATILQQGWEEAGLKTQIEEMDSGTAWNTVVDGGYMAYVSYITSDINDDDELLALQTDPLKEGTQGFFSRYKNEDVTKLLTQSRASTDPAKRSAVLQADPGDHLQRRLQRPAELHAVHQCLSEPCPGLAHPGDRLVVAEGRLGRQVAAGTSPAPPRFSRERRRKRLPSAPAKSACFNSS